jgi:cell division protein FtsZ
LSVAAKGIAEVIKKTGIINVDFNDVNTVMRNSGHAIMGSAQAEGETRACDAVEAALCSPLLNDNDIHGARYILLNIAYGAKEVMMDEISEITDYIEEAAGIGADVIWGHGYDESLGDNISLTIIATGFGTDDNLIVPLERPEPRKMVTLEDDKKLVEIKTPLTAPVQAQSEEQDVEPENNKLDEPFIVEPTQEATAPITDADEPNAEKVIFNLDDEAADGRVDLEPKQESVSWNVSEVVDPVQSEEPIDLFNTETVVRHNLDDGTTEEIDNSQVSSDEVQRNANDRVSKIQEHTAKLKRAEGISEYEKEPAYKRRSIDIDNSKPSESKPSRFGLSDNEDGGTDLSDNSFLHDNVD